MYNFAVQLHSRDFKIAGRAGLVQAELRQMVLLRWRQYCTASGTYAAAAPDIMATGRHQSCSEERSKVAGPWRRSKRWSVTGHTISSRATRFLSVECVQAAAKGGNVKGLSTHPRT